MKCSRTVDRELRQTTVHGSRFTVRGSRFTVHESGAFSWPRSVPPPESVPSRRSAPDRAWPGAAGRFLPLFRCKRSAGCCAAGPRRRRCCPASTWSACAACRSSASPACSSAWSWPCRCSASSIAWAWRRSLGSMINITDRARTGPGAGGDHAGRTRRLCHGGGTGHHARLGADRCPVVPRRQSAPPSRGAAPAGVHAAHSAADDHGRLHGHHGGRPHLHAAFTASSRISTGAIPPRYVKMCDVIDGADQGDLFRHRPSPSSVAIAGSTARREPRASAGPRPRRLSLPSSPSWCSTSSWPCCCSRSTKCSSAAAPVLFWLTACGLTLGNSPASVNRKRQIRWTDLLWMPTPPLINLEKVGMEFGSQHVLRDIDLAHSARPDAGRGRRKRLRQNGAAQADHRAFAAHAAAASPSRTRCSTDLSDRELTRQRLRFGFLFQGAALFDSLSVFDNVAFGLREQKKLSEPEIAERVRQRLSEVGLPAGTGSEKAGRAIGRNEKAGWTGPRPGPGPGSDAL